MASSSSLALSTLLSTLHTHLNAQTQLLPQLHSQLGLPATALEDELQELQHNLTRAVESQIEVRKKQVEEWETRCEGVETACLRYARALGTHAKVAGSFNEIKSEKVLPRRHERAMEHQERLRQVYHTKLEQLTTLTNRLSAVARSLGSSYFSVDILRPTVSAEEDQNDPNALRDVMPERFSKLEKELVRGKGEMTKRMALLGDIFLQIDWLHAELGIDSPEVGDAPALLIASSSTLTAPTCALPRSSSNSLQPPNSDPFVESTSTPTPSCQGRSDARLLFRSASPSPTSASEPGVDPVREFHHAFSRFVQLLDSSSTPDPVPATLLGSLAVEPTQKMLSYAEQRCNELAELKKRREAHIQAMYDQLESLWRRMGVDDAAMDAFVEANRGTTPQVIQAYEEELERMIDLKRERMEEFIGNARSEIESLWDELMAGEDERADFAAFADDEHTEDLLSQHEHEIAQLKTEVRLKTPILASIKKYFDICEEEKELERAAGDQTRLLGRGGGSRDPGRLLREEKMRKRVGKEKPKLEQQLLLSLPAWEQANGRSFLVHGESMLRFLMERISANEQENKKKVVTSQYSTQALNASKPTGPLTRSRSLEPTNSNTGKEGYIPGKAHNPPPGTVTPAVRSGSSMSQTTTKRQKLADGRAKPVRSSSPEKGRTLSGPASGLPRPGVYAAPPVSHVTTRTKHAEGYTSLGWGRVPSTLQRATSRAASSSGVSSHRLASSAKPYGATSMGSGIARAVSGGKGGRIKRESFRPRPSIDGVRGAGTVTVFRGMPPTEEEC